VSGDAVQFAREFLSRDVSLDEKMSSPPSTSELQRMGQALELAARAPDSNDYDTLVALAAKMLRNGERFPPWLANFAADVLTGKIPRPTKRGPDKYSKYDRDYKISRCVDEVSRRFGLPKYDNSGLSEKTTASKIVSEASGLSVDVVVTAYQKHNRSGGVNQK
jgi:hypothetical protein